MHLTIERLSRGGDGVAVHDGKKIYIAGTAPGDVVEATLTPAAGGVYRGQAVTSITPSDKRAEPFCPYVGTCGGCSLQHIDEHTYRDFKTDIAAKAADACGSDAYMTEAPLYGERGERKRATFSVGGEKSAPFVGFHMRAGKEIVAIDHCAICMPDINVAITALNAMLKRMKKPGVITTIAVDVLPEGLDVLIHTKRTLKPAEEQPLRALAMQPGFARVCLKQDDVKPFMLAEQTSPSQPAGAFGQATLRGGAALTAAVMRHTEGAKNVTDLYSGCGGYALSLARAGIRVNAYEGDAFMTAALHNSAYDAGLSSKIEAHTRDLYKSPVSASALSTTDAIVINPPRNGALPQCKEIAASKVKKVVMLSCNPSAFSRDASALTSAGYRLTSLQMIDQFYRSAHIELAGCFVLGDA